MSMMILTLNSRQLLSATAAVMALLFLAACDKKTPPKAPAPPPAVTVAQPISKTFVVLKFSMGMWPPIYLWI